MTTRSALLTTSLCEEVWDTEGDRLEGKFRKILDETPGKSSTVDFKGHFIVVDRTVPMPAQLMVNLPAMHEKAWLLVNGESPEERELGLIELQSFMGAWAHNRVAWQYTVGENHPGVAVNIYVATVKAYVTDLTGKSMKELFDEMGANAGLIPDGCIGWRGSTISPGRCEAFSGAPEDKDEVLVEDLDICLGRQLTKLMHEERTRITVNREGWPFIGMEGPDNT